MPQLNVWSYCAPLSPPLTIYHAIGTGTTDMGKLMSVQALGSQEQVLIFAGKITL